MSVAVYVSAYMTAVDRFRRHEPSNGGTADRANRTARSANPSRAGAPSHRARPAGVTPDAGPAGSHPNRRRSTSSGQA
jgi:hypothetical protein